MATGGYRSYAPAVRARARAKATSSRDSFLWVALTMRWFLLASLSTLVLDKGGGIRVEVAGWHTIGHRQAGLHAPTHQGIALGLGLAYLLRLPVDAWGIGRLGEAPTVDSLTTCLPPLSDDTALAIATTC